ELALIVPVSSTNIYLVVLSVIASPATASHLNETKGALSSAVVRIKPSPADTSTVPEPPSDSIPPVKYPDEPV
ncbi:hypothetical protein LCGC14_2185210, partial [marine sediment metagenome]